MTVPKRKISFDQLKGHINDIIRQINNDDWRPDLIIGITRGGALPAVMMSHYFNCKMVGMDVSLRDFDSYGPETNCWAAEDAMEGKKILIVDDINDSGATINWILRDWDQDGTRIKWGDTVRFAVIVDNLASKATYSPTYCGEEINKAVRDEWIVFPYEEWWK
jgi:hypoxanthine phosphoribosyltransferase